MGVSSLPKTVTRQRRHCDLNPGPSAPEPSTLATRLPSHPVTACVCIQAYSSINEEQAMTSPSPPPASAALPPAAAAAAGVGGGVARHSTPASSRWLRLRLHASATGAGGGRRGVWSGATSRLRRRRRREASAAVGPARSASSPPGVDGARLQRRPSHGRRVPRVSPPRPAARRPTAEPRLARLVVGLQRAAAGPACRRLAAADRPRRGERRRVGVWSAAHAAQLSQRRTQRHTDVYCV